MGRTTTSQTQLNRAGYLDLQNERVTEAARNFYNNNTLYGAGNTRWTARLPWGNQGYTPEQLAAQEQMRGFNADDPAHWGQDPYSQWVMGQRGGPGGMMDNSPGGPGGPGDGGAGAARAKLLAELKGVYDAAGPAIEGAGNARLLEGMGLEQQRQAAYKPFDMKTNMNGSYLANDLRKQGANDAGYIAANRRGNQELRGGVGRFQDYQNTAHQTQGADVNQAATDWRDYIARLKQQLEANYKEATAI